MSPIPETSGEIMLPSDFNQKTLDSLVSQVNTCVDNGGPFQLNGSEVERTDCAAIQFLVVCQKLRSDCKIPNEGAPLILSASDVLQNSIDQIGAQKYLASSSN